jgi:uncharacterized repeat protein (TIGR03803 family)
LSPPTVSGGAWTETVLWSFVGGADGQVPSYQLVIDGKGNLYGETQIGGDATCWCGTVFELSPPATLGGDWAKVTVYTFKGLRATVPYGGLAIDKSGALYGTRFSGGLFGAGLAFKIAPATGGGFRETTLYNFGATSTDSAQPFGPLTIDSSGNLYGVSFYGGAEQLGTVYKLFPPANGTGPWSNAVLYSFPGTSAGCNPQGNVFLDEEGRLYGQATGCGGPSNTGLVFRLMPSSGSGAWVEAVLYTFGGTDGGGLYPSLSFDRKRKVFYGTSFYGGTMGRGNGLVFRLSPPSEVGAWTETVLHTFTGGSSDGSGPLGPIVWDANGVLYGTSYGTNDNISTGKAYSITP